MSHIPSCSESERAEIDELTRNLESKLDALIPVRKIDAMNVEYEFDDELLNIFEMN